MKQNKILLGVILSCLIVMSLSADDCCGHNIFRVSGNGQTKTTANIAILSSTINVIGKTATQALNNIDAKLDSIYSALKQNGVSQSDIQTGYISIYPTYDYSSGTSVINGYSVYVSLSFTIRGIDKNSKRIANVIDDVSSAGVSSLSGITYDTVDPNSGKSVARKNAWKDAEAKAKQYAQLSGRKLGKVIAIE